MFAYQFLSSFIGYHQQTNKLKKLTNLQVNFQF